MSEKQGFFKIKQVTKLSDLTSQEVKIIPESDLTIQTNDEIVQFEYEEGDDKDKFIIKPGCFTIEENSCGTNLESFKLKKNALLESIDNTHIIRSEAEKFFNKIDTYRKLKRDPKRSLLLCSVPGVGKTAAINKVCEEFLAESGTCVVVWDTSSVRAHVVSSFFLSDSEFEDSVKKLILVIEDIEGGTSEDYNGPRKADSSLLNLLDGIGDPFKGVPTFIIATTNNPEQSVGALIDRPGRFDKVMQMKTPNEKECIELIKFIAGKDSLSGTEIEAAKIAAAEEFSIAHIQELVVRSMIDDISILEATGQLKEHKKRFKNAFQQNVTGIGFNQ